MVRDRWRSKPQRGDPLKAQGAQPCKGDQTLGKVEAIRIEPHRGDPPKQLRMVSADAGSPHRGVLPCWLLPFGALH